MENNAPDPRLVARYILEFQKNQDNFMRFQIDPTEEIEELKRDLLGLKYDEETGEYVADPNKEALLNEKGANTILTFLRMRISKVSSLSDLDDAEIDNRCLHFANDLTYLVVRHKNEYDVKSLQVVANIIGLCDDVFFTTLKKARNAGERDSLRKQYTHVESTESVTQMQKKAGNNIFVNPLGGKA